MQSGIHATQQPSYEPSLYNFAFHPSSPDAAQQGQPFDDGDDIRIHHIFYISPSGTGCMTLPTEKRATESSQTNRDTHGKLLFVSVRPSVRPSASVCVISPGAIKTNEAVGGGSIP